MHTTALCSPSRSCIITGRNHHANATAAINELATGYPGYNGSIPFENGFLSEMLLAARLQHLHGRQVPPDAVGVRVRGGPVRPVAAGPRVRAVLRVPRRGHQPVVSGPDLRQPPGRAAAHPRAGLPPDRGSGGQGDRVHRRRQAGRPAQAVLPAFLHGRDARPASRAEGVGRPVRRPVRRRLGRLPGAGVRPAAGTGHHAGRRGAVPARPGRPGLGLAVAGRAQAGGPDDGGVRRVPVPHRPSRGPADRLPEGDRGVRQHADHGGVGQRGQRRGRAYRGPPTSCSSSTTRPSRWRTASGRSTSSAAPTTFNHYPWGWTWAGNTPFRRWKRETYRGGACDPFLVLLAAGIRRAARSAPSTRTSSTWSRPCWTPWGSSRPRRSGA